MVMAAQRQAVAAKAQALGDLDQEALEAKRKKLAEIKPIPGRLTVKLVGGRCVPGKPGCHVCGTACCGMWHCCNALAAMGHRQGFATPRPW